MVCNITDDEDWSDLLELSKNYKYCVIDTISAIEMYFDRQLAKQWNTEHVSDKGFIPIISMDSVPFGGGYGPLRNKVIGFMVWLQSMFKLIYLGHSKDKQINDTYAELDLAAKGKLGSIIKSRVDVIAYLSQNDNKCTLSFDNTNNESSIGGRISYDDILISEKIDDKIVTYWEKIYPDINK